MSLAQWGNQMTGVSRVLVVEDQILILLDLVEQLRDFGIEAVPLTSAVGAAAAISRGGIDALMTDIELPGGVTGLELARECADIRPDLPIVVVSGGVTPGPKDLPSGAVFMSKPYSLQSVVDALNRNAHPKAA